MPARSWNFGDMLDRLGTELDDSHTALIDGNRLVSWPDMTRRSNNLARAMLGAGLQTGDKIGFYLRNQLEYMEGFAATAKARLTHVNVNYRYLDDELSYIFENSDSAGVFFDVAFRENVERVRHNLPKVKLWIEVGGDPAATPDFAIAYETLALTGEGEALGIPRSGDDQMFLYTGGTTGMPKGVMWSHDIWRSANADGLRRIYGGSPDTDEEYISFVNEIGRHSRQLPACPLMHGTGLFTALGAFLYGGTVVTLPNREKFDPVDLWTTVDKHQVTAIAIVGDAFAKPMLSVLDAEPGRFDLSSIKSITSSGVMWSMEVKQGLLKHMPGAALLDSFGSSEAVGFGMSVTTVDGVSETARFELGEHCKVFSEDGREIPAGSDEPGFVARGGAVPLGYYKDPVKSEKTFKTINGVRYAIPGDWCTVAADGTLTLLGRGSICINSGGEKIYPEEVEEALKEHDAVIDALVVGVPDEKWGQAVTGVVELSGTTDIEEDVLRGFVKDRLAAYKAPKRIVFVHRMMRAPNGKADYKSALAFAKTELGIAS